MPIIRSLSTAAAASGLPQDRGDSSAVGRVWAGRPDHDQQHCYHHGPTVNQLVDSFECVKMHGPTKPKEAKILLFVLCTFGVGAKNNGLHNAIFSTVVFKIKCGECFLESQQLESADRAKPIRNASGGYAAGEFGGGISKVVRQLT